MQRNEIFRKVKAAYDPSPLVEGLVCKEGAYMGSAVLKLQKASWTNDSMDKIRNESGIFFAIWVDDKSLRRNRASYSIHALKLRQLRGYALTSRNFAEAFRARFKKLQKAWPNVRVDYGPQTLMQGWIEIHPVHFERDVVALMKSFATTSAMIDELLKEASAERSRS